MVDASTMVENRTMVDASTMVENGMMVDSSTIVDIDHQGDSQSRCSDGQSNHTTREGSHSSSREDLLSLKETRSSNKAPAIQASIAMAVNDSEIGRGTLHQGCQSLRRVSPTQKQAFPCLQTLIRPSSPPEQAPQSSTPVLSPTLIDPASFKPTPKCFPSIENISIQTPEHDPIRYRISQTPSLSAIVPIASGRDKEISQNFRRPLSAPPSFFPISNDLHAAESKSSRASEPPAKDREIRPSQRLSINPASLNVTPTRHGSIQVSDQLNRDSSVARSTASVKDYFQSPHSQRSLEDPEFDEQAIKKQLEEDLKSWPDALPHQYEQYIVFVSCENYPSSKITSRWRSLERSCLQGEVNQEPRPFHVYYSRHLQPYNKLICWTLFNLHLSGERWPPGYERRFDEESLAKIEDEDAESVTTYGCASMSPGLTP